MADTLSGALNVASGSNTIIPGTTPKLVLTVEDSIMDSTKEIRLDIIQNGVVILQILDNTIEGHKVSHTFTQSETYAMTPGATLRVQAHGKTENGTAWKSNVMELSVGSSLTNTII